MPKKGHTEEQIIAALKQQEAGDKTADICRKLGISQATFYMWKRQYAGLGVQELRECVGDWVGQSGAEVLRGLLTSVAAACEHLPRGEIRMRECASRFQ